MKNTLQSILETYKNTDPRLVLLTEREESVIVRLAPGTLQNLRSKGGGPPYIKINGAVRYRLSDTMAYLDQGIKHHTAV